MAKSSGAPYRFGDLLVLARQSWLTQMAEGVAQLGYQEYRRSDAAIIRALARAPLTIAGVGQTLGITRQAARKVVDGLQARGLVLATRDQSDGRAVQVRLNKAGEAYAHAVTAVIDQLNSELVGRVEPQQLEAADSVLRAVLQDDHTRRLASRLPRPSAKPRTGSLAETVPHCTLAYPSGTSLVKCREGTVIRVIADMAAEVAR